MPNSGIIEIKGAASKSLVFTKVVLLETKEVKREM
jgi:hypothetical protein